MAYYKYRSSRSAIRHLIQLCFGDISPKHLADSDYALSDVSFTLLPGHSLALLGRNGAGKSTLLKLIAGVLKPTYGYIHRPSRITAILELGTGMNPHYSGRRNAYRFCRFSGYSHRQSLSKIDLIQSFAEIDDYFDQPIKTYSSGMFARLAFACSIHVESDLLLLDEILSVGDLGFTQKCVQYLQDQYLSCPDKSVIYVGHNTEVAERICTSGIVLERGRVFYEGPISDAINAYHSTLVYKPSSRSLPVTSDAPPFQPSPDTPSGFGFLEAQACFNKSFTPVGPKYPAYISRISVSPSPLPDLLNPHTSIKFLLSVFSYEDCLISIGFSLSTLEGIVVTGSSTHLRKTILKVQSNQEYSFLLTVQLHLNPGKYTSNLGLDIVDSSGVPRFCDLRRQVLLFEVCDPYPENSGLVPLDFDVSTHET